jgi:hypothetical protein
MLVYARSLRFLYLVRVSEGQGRFFANSRRQVLVEVQVEVKVQVEVQVEV